MAYEADSRFVTIKAAAKMLGVSPLTLRNWDKKKKLIAYRHPINNYRVYKLDDINEFLQKIENTNKPKKVKIEFLKDDADDDADEENSSEKPDEDVLKI